MTVHPTREEAHAWREKMMRGTEHDAQLHVVPDFREDIKPTRRESEADEAEQAHTLLSKVMADVGHLLPYRAVIEWWLEAHHPDRRLEVVG